MIIKSSSKNVQIYQVDSCDLITEVQRLSSDKNLSLKIIDATDERLGVGGYCLWYIFGNSQTAQFTVLSLWIKVGTDFPSIASINHIAASYERKIKGLFGLNPVGNCDLRPINLHENWPRDIYPLTKDVALDCKPEIANDDSYNFAHVKGDGIYEIPVGPIHAGIIEPGHFRFSVAGEQIMLLEARLGYTHKGSEKLFENLDMTQKIRLSEKISGDSSFSHSLAFCQAVEQLLGLEVPARGRYLRTIFSELERLANHFGDIGMIMLDAGYNFGGGQGPRLRELIMRLNYNLTGSRFLRGVNTYGGVTCDISAKTISDICSDILDIQIDFDEVIGIAESSASLLNRLANTGILTKQVANDYGVLGVPARAIGIARDTRIDFPYAAYDQVKLTAPALGCSGDVQARFLVRIKEVRASIELILGALATIPSGDICSEQQEFELPKNSLAISAVEGWRGEIFYCVMTDSTGKISRVMLRDPSFVNWQVVGHCGPGNIVPDFPLINKSFNLSYTGHDL